MTNETENKFPNMYSSLATDENKENEGIWRTYSTNSKGKPVRLRIKRAGSDNLDFVRAMEKYTRNDKHRINAKTISTDENRKIMAKIYSEAIVVDWEGAENAKGEDVPYSRPQVERTLAELPRLLRMVIGDANDDDLFAPDNVEVIAGN